MAVTLTQQELDLIRKAATRIWAQIGGDVLRAMEEMGEPPEIDRDSVIEIVLDADRLTEDLRMDRQLTDAMRTFLTGPDHAARTAFMRTVFTATHYGW